MIYKRMSKLSDPGLNGYDLLKNKIIGDLLNCMEGMEIYEPFEHIDFVLEELINDDKLFCISYDRIDEILSKKESKYPKK